MGRVKLLQSISRLMKLGVVAISAVALTANGLRGPQPRPYFQPILKEEQSSHWQKPYEVASLLEEPYQFSSMLEEPGIASSMFEEPIIPSRSSMLQKPATSALLEEPDQVSSRLEKLLETE